MNVFLFYLVQTGLGDNRKKSSQLNKKWLDYEKTSYLTRKLCIIGLRINFNCSKRRKHIVGQQCFMFCVFVLTILLCTKSYRH